jgi:hypothetical protein
MNAKKNPFTTPDLEWKADVIPAKLQRYKMLNSRTHAPTRTQLAAFYCAPALLLSPES